MSEKGLIILFIRIDEYGRYITQKRLENVDPILMDEVQHLIKVGKKKYLQDNVY